MIGTLFTILGIAIIGGIVINIVTNAGIKCYKKIKEAKNQKKCKSKNTQEQ